MRACVCVCVWNDEVVIFPHPSMLLSAGKEGCFNANVYYNRVKKIMLDVL